MARSACKYRIAQRSSIQAAATLKVGFLETGALSATLLSAGRIMQGCSGESPTADNGESGEDRHADSGTPGPPLTSLEVLEVEVKCLRVELRQAESRVKQR
ncbi:hypothetical protein J6590_082519 [Homalodisca vitripennis]|nr:hypothetical protein J6590_082519 [Homalodisca vitripennis]